MAPKLKLNTGLESDTISADEEKQMSDMRATDVHEEPEREPKVQESSSEPREEPADKPEPQDKPKTVPHEAMEAERQRRKAAEKEREELRIENAKASERIKLINEMMEAQKKPAQVEIPDPDKDALGNLKYNNDEIRVLKEYVARQESQKQQDAQTANLMNRAASLEREFINQNADYTEASKFLETSRYNELTAFGLAPDQARAQLGMETLQLANQGLTTGKNPAEMVYALAKLRGYQKAAQTQQTPAEKLTAISEGQRANQSLSDISGNSASNAKPMNAKDLANMSEVQFAKWMKANKGDDSQMHAVFGN